MNGLFLNKICVCFFCDWTFFGTILETKVSAPNPEVFHPCRIPAFPFPHHWMAFDSSPYHKCGCTSCVSATDPDIHHKSYCLRMTCGHTLPPHMAGFFSLPSDTCFSYTQNHAARFGHHHIAMASDKPCNMVNDIPKYTLPILYAILQDMHRA